MSSRAWKKLDLQGQGLQNANRQLAALLKSRKTAYTLLLFFPAGLHRSYLEDRRTAWFYRLLAVATIALFALGYRHAALLALLPMFGLALYDIRWIEGRISRLNKAIRMKVYLGQGHTAPRGFKGRYADDGLEQYLAQKEGERGGHAPVQPVTDTDTDRPARAPSFAEQEAMLRELSKSGGKKDQSGAPR